MRRLRAGAYSFANYLIRYHAWLGPEWDGAREAYKPWHIFKRTSTIGGRILVEKLGSLDEAQRFVAAQLAETTGRRS